LPACGRQPQLPPSNRLYLSRWVDADSIIINPALSLDIFLPPSDFPDIHFLAAKDENGLNAGIFFIEVHEWSIRVISKALAFPMFRPEVDLSYLEQTAIAYVINETEFRDGVLYQPRIWWNTYEFHHGYEGRAGDLLVHFPGLEDDRWNHMKNWLDIVEGPQAAEWELPLAETRYPEELDRFWTLLRLARTTLEYTNEHIKLDDAPESTKKAIEHLREVVDAETDQMERIKAAVEEVKKVIELQSPPNSSWG